MECSVSIWREEFLDINSNFYRKHNRRSEGREDGSENNDDKVGLLTSAIMEEELEDPDNLPIWNISIFFSNKYTLIIMNIDYY